MRMKPKIAFGTGIALLVLALAAHIAQRNQSAAFAAQKAEDNSPQAIADALSMQAGLAYATLGLAGAGLTVLLVAVLVVAWQSRS